VQIDRRQKTDAQHTCAQTDIHKKQTDIQINGQISIQTADGDKHTHKKAHKDAQTYTARHRQRRTPEPRQLYVKRPTVRTYTHTDTQTDKLKKSSCTDKQKGTQMKRQTA
jgi:hypothetical protein